MTTVRIDSETRELADATEQWVAQQVNRRNSDSVCVEILIKTSGVDLRLATSACGSRRWRFSAAQFK
jgi:hypothetical protein